MKTRLILMIGAMALSQLSIAQKEWKEKIEAYRDSVDAAFADPETSILEEDHIADFEGLDYYPIDESWRVEVKIKKLKGKVPLFMKHSRPRLKPNEYRKYALLKFKIDGKKYQLTAYRFGDTSPGEEYANYLFIPFSDYTNGEETYGGGRYIELTMEELKEMKILDFNTAYNPYCAYNHGYSCPIPPQENALNFKVEAGVKAYDAEL